MYPVRIRLLALDLIVDGVSRELICKDLGIKKATLEKWIGTERKKDPSRFPKQEMPALQNARVSDVRIVLRMVDENYPLKAICRDTGIDRQTIRRWRDQPKYREATIEYDPSFPYAIDDLFDRALVAHYLAGQTSDVGERLDLLMAACSQADVDDFDVPSSNNTKGRMT